MGQVCAYSNAAAADVPEGQLKGLKDKELESGDVFDLTCR
jgi:hypothetical protein